MASGNGLGAGQSAYLAGLTENASYRSNIGVVNTGTGERDGAGDALRRERGPALPTTRCRWPPGQWAQATQPFLNEAKPDGDGQRVRDGHSAVGIGGVRLRLGDRQHHQRPDHRRHAGVGVRPVVWVPVASHASGLNSSQWRSDLGLLNAGTVAGQRADPVLRQRWRPEQPRPPSRPGRRRSWPMSSGSLAGAGRVRSKSPRISRSMVTSRSYNQVASTASCYPNGTQGQDYPALSPATGSASVRARTWRGSPRTPRTGATSGWSTRGRERDGALELFNGSGNRACQLHRGFGRGSVVAGDAAVQERCGPDAMDSGYATITVQSGSGVFAFASVIDNITNDPTTVDHAAEVEFIRHGNSSCRNCAPVPAPETSAPASEGVLRSFKERRDGHCRVPSDARCGSATRGVGFDRVPRASRLWRPPNRWVVQRRHRSIPSRSTSRRTSHDRSHFGTTRWISSTLKT